MVMRLKLMFLLMCGVSFSIISASSVDAQQEQNFNVRVFSDGKQAVRAVKTKNGLDAVHVYEHLSDGRTLPKIPQLSVFKDSKNSLVVMVFMDATKGSFVVLARGNLIAEKETILEGQILKSDNGTVIDEQVHALGVIEKDGGGISFIFARPKSEDQIVLLANLVARVDDIMNIVTNQDLEDTKLKLWLKNWIEFLPVLRKNWKGPVIVYTPAKATIAALAF